MLCEPRPGRDPFDPREAGLSLDFFEEKGERDPRYLRIPMTAIWSTKTLSQLGLVVMFRKLITWATSAAEILLMLTKVKEGGEGEDNLHQV